MRIPDEFQKTARNKYLFLAYAQNFWEDENPDLVMAVTTEAETLAEASEKITQRILSDEVPIKSFLFDFFTSEPFQTLDLNDEIPGIDDAEDDESCWKMTQDWLRDQIHNLDDLNTVAKRYGNPSEFKLILTQVTNNLCILI